MTKPIEFRFWDAENNEMIYYNECLSCVQAMTWKDGLVYKQGKLQRWTPMQFTGLLDIKGKKIFEHDLITFRSYYEGDTEYKGDVGIVVYENGSYCVKPKTTKWYREFCWENIKNDQIEVIGNIHEDFYQTVEFFNKVLNDEDKSS